MVAARTPGLGVGGSILSGGFGWASGEFGCASDPANLLDAQVVKLDGSVVWASEEPDLLWALRGTCGGFGAVTAFKLQAHPYPTRIWSGPIFIPTSQRDKVAEGVVKAARRTDQEKVAMYLYCVKKEALAALGATEDMLVVHAFDANGEEHGKGEAGFKWALDIPGAMPQMGVMNLREVSALQGGFGRVSCTVRIRKC